jgi:type I restriction-modification system DNA methylase subunit
MSNTTPSLQSALWEAANILRGSAVDRTDWKGYILPLLFFKRISDVWDEEHARMIEQYGEQFEVAKSEDTPPLVERVIENTPTPANARSRRCFARRA